MTSTNSVQTKKYLFLPSFKGQTVAEWLRHYTLGREIASSNAGSGNNLLPSPPPTTPSPQLQASGFSDGKNPKVGQSSLQNNKMHSKNVSSNQRLCILCKRDPAAQHPSAVSPPHSYSQACTLWHSMDETTKGVNTAQQTRDIITDLNRLR